MSDSITMEQGFCDRGMTGDTQHAREWSRPSELETCDLIGDMVNEGSRDDAGDTSEYGAHGAFFEHSSS
jgi:hypothetical protein